MSTMTDFSIVGKRGVQFSDPLFIYIAWTERNDPTHNSLVREIIEDLDAEYFYGNGASQTIRQNLPYLTFKQAEYLFKKLRDNFDLFEFEGLALATQLDKNAKLTGKANIDTTPRIVPFTITKQYKNIVIPLIESAHRDERFKNNSYETLSEYFNRPNGLIPQYGESLGLSRSQFPLYPQPGTIKDELPRQQSSTSISEVKQTRKEKKSKASLPEDYYVPNNKPTTILKVMAVGGMLLGALGLGMGATAIKQAKQANAIASEVAETSKNVIMLQDNEHAVDTFARYFLSYYYMGNKEAIIPFLNDNDAKYTVPASATVVSTLLDDISYNSETETYTVIYLMTFKDEAGTVTRSRLSFDVIENEKSDYGWSVSSEPVSTPFMIATATTSTSEAGD